MWKLIFISFLFFLHSPFILLYKSKDVSVVEESEGWSLTSFFMNFDSSSSFLWCDKFILKVSWENGVKQGTRKEVFNEPVGWNELKFRCRNCNFNFNLDILILSFSLNKSYFKASWFLKFSTKIIFFCQWLL